MARARRAPATAPSIDELKAQALAWIRQHGKKSDREGMKQLQPKGGLAAALSKVLKCSEHAANKVVRSLRDDDKLIEIKPMGRGSSPMVFVKLEGDSGTSGGSRRRSTKSASRTKRRSRRSGGSRSRSNSSTRNRRPALKPATPADLVDQASDVLEQLRSAHQASDTRVVELEGYSAELEARVAELEAILDRARQVIG